MSADYVFVKDQPCPACGFRYASQYKLASGGDKFIVCGRCNSDTRTGSSPTPIEIARSRADGPDGGPRRPFAFEVPAPAAAQEVDLPAIPVEPDHQPRARRRAKPAKRSRAKR